jgi:hypothetical protein
MSTAAERLEQSRLHTRWQGASSPNYPDAETHNRPVIRLIHVNNRIAPPNLQQVNQNGIDFSADLEYEIAAAHYTSDKDMRLTQDNSAYSVKMVPVDTVIKVASAFIGTFSGLAFLANILSGVIIIQPFISVLLIVASLGFYAMSLAKS